MHACIHTYILCIYIHTLVYVPEKLYTHLAYLPDVFSDFKVEVHGCRFLFGHLNSTKHTHSPTQA